VVGRDTETFLVITEEEPLTEEQIEQKKKLKYAIGFCVYYLYKYKTLGEIYKTIFGESMYYCDIDEMVNIMDTNIIDCSYSMPNRDLISYEYHRDIVLRRIAEIRDKYGENPSRQTTFGMPSFTPSRIFNSAPSRRNAKNKFGMVFS
jgi:hypothetical protein